ncbi:hypothetical protein CEXT_153651 [Caerostris extrusa]|uniref:Uncharacterized protein n=1 Tax=Caerostris extrusa TaxID=172846 RepID=A0AAV4RVJ7_CAEEX|nr:hypothetical protein CEXT_153651 [Caerostris extrusa]
MTSSHAIECRMCHENLNHADCETCQSQRLVTCFLKPKYTLIHPKEIKPEQWHWNRPIAGKFYFSSHFEGILPTGFLP